MRILENVVPRERFARLSGCELAQLGYRHKKARADVKHRNHQCSLGPLYFLDEGFVKKVKITLNGTVTYWAQRTFEIEVSDDETLRTVSPNILNDLADLDQVPWSFSESGHLEATDFSVEDCPEPMIGHNDRTRTEENQPTT